jgi:hypothetical protein
MGFSFSFVFFLYTFEEASLVIVIVGVAEQLLEPFWQSAYFLLNGFAMVALLCLARFKSK